MRAKPPYHSPVAVDDDTPAWAADWIPTPEEEDDAAEALELREPPPSTAKDVLTALAGGALAGLAVYGVQRIVESLSDVESAPKRKRSPLTTKTKRLDGGNSGRAAKKRTPKRRQSQSIPAWAYALYGVAEAAKLHEALRAAEAAKRQQAQEQQAHPASARPPRARSAVPPFPFPPSPPPQAPPPAQDEEEVMDARAAATLGIHVDATADQIGVAWRSLVRDKMAAGAFHDQPGANRHETAALISAKNRLIERARRRGART